jgi:hypothetical protein
MTARQLTWAILALDPWPRSARLNRPQIVELALHLGGEGEIRTHEPRKGPPVFKTGAFNRSATSPRSLISITYSIFCPTSNRISGVNVSILFPSRDRGLDRSAAAKLAKPTRAAASWRCRTRGCMASIRGYARRIRPKAVAHRLMNPQLTAGWRELAGSLSLAGRWLHEP